MGFVASMWWLWILVLVFSTIGWIVGLFFVIKSTAQNSEKTSKKLDNEFAGGSIAFLFFISMGITSFLMLMLSVLLNVIDYAKG